ncbi:MAG: hypothetical protein LBM93_04390 [Oscillospiraceae bacterium]|jgi:hypothetical protein|nr:hypothetical protein [Oscillospiraceae bacterium]
MKTFKKSINAFLAAMMLISASSIGISAAPNANTDSGEQNQSMTVEYDTDKRVPFTDGTSLYTVKIPKRLFLSSDQTKNKFTVEVDLTAPFIIPATHSVKIEVDKVIGVITNVASGETVPYALLDSEKENAPFASNLLFEYSDSSLTKSNSKIVPVYFNADDVTVAGKYGDVLNFTISLSEKTTPSEEAQYLLDEPMVPIE